MVQIPFVLKAKILNPLKTKARLFSLDLYSLSAASFAVSFLSLS